MELIVDNKRLEKFGNQNHTGIYVRAKLPNGKWDAVDILLLTKDSLLTWLRSRGGENTWAENCVAILLGHDGDIV